MLGSFKFSMYRIFMFFIFCCDARDRWFIKTNFAPSPQQHPGWQRVGGNEHDTKFMPTSLRGVPNQNLWFTSSFSRSEHRHWHNWWGTGTRMWIPWTHLHVKTKSNYLPLPVSSFYWPAVHLMLVTRSTEAIFLLSIMSIKINWLLAASQASPWLHYC